MARFSRVRLSPTAQGDSFERGCLLFLCRMRLRESWVLVPVQRMDLYKHFGGIFACMGPSSGPVRAPASLILQPFNGDADVDGQVFHSTQGDLPDLAAFQIDIEVHRHFPKLLLLLRV